MLGDVVTLKRQSVGTPPRIVVKGFNSSLVDLGIKCSRGSALADPASTIIDRPS